MIESLEHRLLMRGGVIGLQGRTAYVSGTAGNDVIFLSGSTKRIVVTLNGITKEFVDRDVRRIVVYAGAGIDVVKAGANTFSARRQLYIPAFIDGGTGNDELYSGVKADTLLGSTGDDYLAGEVNQDPGDYHDGGPGDDHLSYGGTMNGGRGYDVATGDNGPDPIVSGIELLQTISDGRGRPENPSVIERENYRGDLSTRNGNLVFRFPTTAGFRTSLGSPALNSDGVMVITLKTRFVSQVFQQAESEVSTLLDRDSAVQRGILLNYDDPSGVFSSESQQWVLVPPRI